MSDNVRCWRSKDEQDQALLLGNQRTVVELNIWTNNLNKIISVCTNYGNGRNQLCLIIRITFVKKNNLNFEKWEL